MIMMIVFFPNNDADLQYFNEINPFLNHGSDYYTENSFINKCRNDLITNDNFSLLHLNIRSIPKNLNNLTLYLETIQHKFSVIGITES